MPANWNPPSPTAQMIPAILGAGFLLLTLFFNTQTLNVLKEHHDPDVAVRRFHEQQDHELAACVKGSELLREATAELEGVAIAMPREMEICLRARANADSRLRDAARLAKVPFAMQLGAWSAETRAVSTYCAYAMRFGSE